MVICDQIWMEELEAAVFRDDFCKDKLKMLVVEDEPSTASNIKRLLCRRFNAYVDVAADLATARLLLGSCRYDLVTLDQLLPDGSGIEFLIELHHNPCVPRVVMVSALDRSSIDPDPLDLGAFDYIMKDEKMACLLPNAVRRALGMAQ